MAKHETSTPSGTPEKGRTEDGSDSLRNRVGLWLGPLLFLLILLLTDLEPGKPAVTAMAAIAVLMATWWITEAIPIPATALLPIVLFPLMGIMRGDSKNITSAVRSGESHVWIDPNVLSLSVAEENSKQFIVEGVAREYMSWLILLFLGGFLIAIAVERWGLHKRIALHILRVIGGRPHRLVLGFMAATAFLSMWLSNTATTMMMMPMALSLIVLYEELNASIIKSGGALDHRVDNFPVALMLGLAYGAAVGGVSTLIGTPPNGVLIQQFEAIFPNAPSISFAQWMFFATPFGIVFMFIMWIVLTRFIFPLPEEGPFSGKKFIRKEIKALGPISTEEKRVACVFAGVALLWMTRKNIVLGRPGDVDAFTIPGWSSLLESSGVAGLIDDGTVSIAMALLLFVIPAGKATGGRLMDWDAAKKVPWGILLLFGGGLALAKGFSVSGLSHWIGIQLQDVLEGTGRFAMITMIIIVVAALTELTSNTATASMALPIVASLAKAVQVHPLMLMIPAALAASCAFVLPVSTPPNAIVYGSGRVTIMQMIKAGLVMELIALVLITISTFTLAVWSFDVLGDVPTWIQSGQ